MTISTLEGKVAVITGGASGIGEASVRRFIAAGASVVFADVEDHRGRTLAESLGGRCSYQRADVSTERDIRRLIETTMERHGRLDCLFNNAGVAGPGGPIEALQPDSWDAMLAVLLRSVFLGMHFAAPVMKAQGNGSIISTASVAGVQAGFGSHVYSAAKAAVIQLTRSVATELGESGVRVNCICPGGVATPLFGKAAGCSQEHAVETLALVRSALADLQPLHRAGLPEDVAEAALWLASDSASFITGHALVVDGGLSSGRSWSESMRRRDRLRAALSVPIPGER
jgi:NAD(P)-dependent dehydrogenase (short-subunit alcohol dehydrogenase family)